MTELHTSLTARIVAQPNITRLDPTAAAARLPELSALLHSCVHAGANIGFNLPFPEQESAAWWKESVLPHMTNASRILLICEIGGKIVASGQLALSQCEPASAEVMKVMTDPEYRRCGYARAIMKELEQVALMHDRTTLILDTSAGDAAEPLYHSMGYKNTWLTAGSCCNPTKCGADETTSMRKELEALDHANVVSV